MSLSYESTIHISEMLALLPCQHLQTITKEGDDEESDEEDEQRLLEVGGATCTHAHSLPLTSLVMSASQKCFLL